MIHVDYEKCVGCAACANICPQKCIEMVQNEEGFYYPSVDTQKCVSCSLCNKVCLLEAAPAQNNKEPLQTFAAYAKDDAVRAGSSSGGVFYYLANYVFSIGGVVFGAAFSEDLTVHHVCAKNAQELKPLMRSKYVQSRIGNAYAQAQAYLKKGTPVLFTGTPCQIEGLKMYLGEQEYAHLYVVAVACHGVPGEIYWKKYLRYLGILPSAQDLNFRDKKNGWQNYFVSFGNFSEPYFQNPYMKLFLKDYILRPSCYNCPAKAHGAQAYDLLIADFWGIQQVDPSMFDDKGTSLLLSYSPKGNDLIDKMQEKFVMQPEDFAQAIKYNPSIVTAAHRPDNYSDCLRALNASEVPDFAQIAQKYCPQKRNHSNLFKRAVRKALRILHFR